MACSGVVSQQLQGLSTSGAALTRSGATPLPSSHVSYGSRRSCCFSGEARLRSGFRDDRHLEYYSGGVSVRCGSKVEKEVKKTKKRLRMVNKELTLLSKMEFDSDEVVGSAGESQGKRLAEAAEILLNQLQKLKAEEKELKKQRKLEKARLKSERMKLMIDSSSSSSSSSSSEGETEVIDMTSLRTDPPAKQPLPTIDAMNTVKIETCCRPNAIEVCTGKKCSNSGAAALIEEFQRSVGGEVPVVGCKCMGKCRDGPNVRVSSEKRFGMEDDGSVRVSSNSNPLFIGVGLEDVDARAGNFVRNTIARHEHDTKIPCSCKHLATR